MRNEELIVNEGVAFNPILHALLKPRETIQYIINNDRTLYYPVLIYLYGLIRSMDNYARRSYDISILVIVLLAITSPISGYIGCYIYAWLMSIFGRVFNGNATNEELRLSILWSSVPLMIILPISIFTFVLGADNLYYHVTQYTVVLVLYWLLAFIEIIIAIWCFINLLRMVSEVQGFSKGKAFLSIILPFVILAVLMLVILIPLNRI